MGKFVSRPLRGPLQPIDAGSGKDAYGSSSDIVTGSPSDIVTGSLHKEDAMWIEVQDGTSQETRDDTFWEEMARAVFQVSLLIRSAFCETLQEFAGHW